MGTGSFVIFFWFCSRRRQKKKIPKQSVMSQSARGGRKRQGGGQSGDSRPPQSRLLHATACMIGVMVRVRVLDGTLYEGVFHSAKTQRNGLGVVLKQVRVVETDSPFNAPYKTKVTPQMTIDSENFVSLEAPNVDVSAPFGSSSAASSRNSSGFTDGEISGGSSGAGRKLVAWQPDSNDTSQALGGLESRSSNTQWDQFAANRERFGVTSTWDEHEYTTKVDKSAPDYQERERAAAKLAREMEREGRSKATTNVHLLEERGVDVSHIDEEARYGAVVREADAASTTTTTTTKSRKSSGKGAVTTSGKANATSDKRRQDKIQVRDPKQINALNLEVSSVNVNKAKSTNNNNNNNNNTNKAGSATSKAADVSDSSEKKELRPLRPLKPLSVDSIKEFKPLSMSAASASSFTPTSMKAPPGAITHAQLMAQQQPTSPPSSRTQSPGVGPTSPQPPHQQQLQQQYALQQQQRNAAALRNYQMQQWQMMQQQQQMFDLNTPLSEVYASAMHVQLAQRPATNGVAPSRSLSHQWPAVRGPYSTSIPEETDSAVLMQQSAANLARQQMASGFYPGSRVPTSPQGVMMRPQGQAVPQMQSNATPSPVPSPQR